MDENKLLLSELQHRAKNSFMMISGMITISEQMSQNADVKTELHELSSKINAVSSMYDLLYETKQYIDVRLDEYLIKIISSIPRPENQVEVIFKFDQITISVKKSITVGLIITELVTNAYKYAFPDDRKAKIHISAKKKKDNITIHVRDNGIGIQGDIALLKKNSMGLMLIDTLSQQLNGVLDLKDDDGTNWQLVFED